MNSSRPPVALTIAGSDSGGGAGIQADLKTFERFGVFGTSVLTLVTAQNTVGVRAIHMLPTELVIEQFAAVIEDFPVAVIKLGAMGSVDMVECVAEILDQVSEIPVVVDPVMISKHGASLLPEEAHLRVRALLVPRADVLTPNLFEAEALLGRELRGDDAMREAGRELRAMGARNVVIKGGGSSTETAVDYLFTKDDVIVLSTAREEPLKAHGTGCTFSSAIAAGLAQGLDIEDAARQAKKWIHRAIRAAPDLGAGHPPVLHRVE